MSEAFIPPAPATPETVEVPQDKRPATFYVDGFGYGDAEEIGQAYRHLLDSNAGFERELEALKKRELERQPLVEAIEYIVERGVERWIDSEYGREQLGRVIEEQLAESIDSHVEAALENATVEVDAYIRL